jgi:hypothetical protein
MWYRGTHSRWREEKGKEEARTCNEMGIFEDKQEGQWGREGWRGWGFR